MADLTSILKAMYAPPSILAANQESAFQNKPIKSAFFGSEGFSRGFKSLSLKNMIYGIFSY